MPGPKTNEREGTRAVLRNEGVSAYKVRQVLDLIRGQEVDRARDTLALCERDAALRVGKLLGSAIIGTLETVREKYHSSQLSEAVTLGDPLVVQRLQQLSGAYGRVLSDPALRTAEGQVLLQQQITQQAHVLAYNDVFLLMSAFAALGCVWVTFNHFRPRLQARLAERDAASAAAAVE